MKLSCMIVDDEPLARQLLEEYIKKVPSLTLIQSFSSPIEAMDFLTHTAPDILFLDVQMPEITGITLLKILQKKPAVILTTAYSEYAIESYELDVTDYLLKPITLERFLKAVEKAKAKIQTEYTPQSIGTEAAKPDSMNHDPIHRTDYFFVKDGNKQVKVNFDSIMYIEGLKDYVMIYLPNQKITTLQNLKTLEQVLPSDRFIRVHNSFIVSVDWIDSIQRDCIDIGPKMIPVSDTYRKAFRDFIEHKKLG